MLLKGVDKWIWNTRPIDICYRFWIHKRK